MTEEWYIESRFAQGGWERARHWDNSFDPLMTLSEAIKLAKMCLSIAGPIVVYRVCNERTGKFVILS